MGIDVRLGAFNSILRILDIDLEKIDRIAKDFFQFHSTDSGRSILRPLREILEIAFNSILRIHAEPNVPQLDELPPFNSILRILP